MGEFLNFPRGRFLSMGIKKVSISGRSVYSKLIPSTSAIVQG